MQVWPWYFLPHTLDLCLNQYFPCLLKKKEKLSNWNKPCILVKLFNLVFFMCLSNQQSFHKTALRHPQVDWASNCWSVTPTKCFPEPIQTQDKMWCWWSTLDHTFMHPLIGSWRRRQWQPTPVLLPGNSHGQRSLVGYNPWGREESDMTERLYFHFSLSCLGEGNGSPLQCSCLENPRDRGAWWAAIYGVAKSRTWLKRLSSSSSIGSWLY